MAQSKEQKVKLTIQEAIYKWEAKHRQKLTYRILSDKTGISVPTLHRMIHNRTRRVDLEKLYQLSVVLECSVGDLIKRKDE